MGSTKIQKQDLDMEGLASAIQTLMESGAIEVGEKAYTPSSNLLKTLVSSENKSTASGSFKYMAKWIPEHTGQVKILFSSKYSKSTYPGLCMAYTGSMIAQNTSLSSIGAHTLISPVGNVLAILENSSVGSTINLSTDNFMGIKPSNSSYTNEYVLLNVEKGVPVYFGVICMGSNSEYTIYCNRIAIYADEV